MPFDGVSGPSVGMQRLLRLADRLDRVPPQNYYQDAWKEERSCGTVACALGWADEEMGEEIGLSFEEYSNTDRLYPVINGVSVIDPITARLNWAKIGELFDVDADEARSLFGDSHDVRERYGSDRHTPAVVAAGLRRFVESKVTVR